MTTDNLYYDSRRNRSDDLIQEFLLDDLSYEEINPDDHEYNVKAIKTWNRHVRKQFAKGYSRQWLVFTSEFRDNSSDGTREIREHTRIFAGKARSLRHAIEKSSAKPGTIVFVYKIELRESDSIYHLHHVVDKHIGAYQVPEPVSQ